MLVDRYRAALGKSTRSQSLYDHCMSCVDAALRVAALAGEEPGIRLDRLILATFVHDVGKLDPGFQAMLRAAAANEQLPDRRVKHEASTLDYDHIALVEDSKETIRAEIFAAYGYCLREEAIGPGAMVDVWAFAVTHHGLFYLSYEEDRNGFVRPLVRREWTAFYPNERRRITLVDLLFRYHPVGGLVVMADLIASVCHERAVAHDCLFGRARSLRDVCQRLIEYADETQDAISAYDPRDYALKETLTLLAGGIR